MSWLAGRAEEPHDIDKAEAQAGNDKRPGDTDTQDACAGFSRDDARAEHSRDGEIKCARIAVHECRGPRDGKLRRPDQSRRGDRDKENPVIRSQTRVIGRDAHRSNHVC